MNAHAGQAMSVERTPDLLLKVLFALLIAFTASHIALALFSIPLYYQRVSSGTVPELVLGGIPQISNELVAQWAAERGLSLRAYALYNIVLQLFLTLGFAGVALVILWKARREWFHWFTAMVLLFIPTSGLWDFVMVARIGYSYSIWGSLLWPLFPLFLYLFPNGRAVPRWSRWLMLAVALLHLLIQAAAVADQHGLLSAEITSVAFSLTAFIFVALPLILVSQVYRYLRVSDPTERAQTRWFLAGMASWILLDLLIELWSQLSIPGTGLANGYGDDIGRILMLFIPLSIGVGILRYRLYDIDLIIRRTFTYAVLSAALVLLFFAGVTVLQALFTSLTGQQSPAALVLSTLLIAALFNPLRSRIQGFIDRRFFRSQYDPGQALARFSNTARSQVNLTALAAELVRTADQSLKPQNITLWLAARPDVPGEESPHGRR